MGSLFTSRKAVPLDRAEAAQGRARVLTAGMTVDLAVPEGSTDLLKAQVDLEASTGRPKGKDRTEDTGLHRASKAAAMALRPRKVKARQDSLVLPPGREAREWFLRPSCKARVAKA